MKTYLLRLRVFVSDRRTALILLAVALILTGAFVAHGDNTVEEVRVVESWTVSGETHHEADVQNGGTLYGENETVEDRPVYYTDVSPTFDAEYTVSYAADTADNVTIDINTTLVYGAKQDGFLWRETEGIGNVSDTYVRPEEAVAVNFSVNVTEVKERIEEVESDLGASVGETVVYVRVDVSVNGRLEGQQRQAVLTDRVNVSSDEGTYEVDADGFEEPFEDRETVTVEEDDPVAAGGYAAAGAGILVLVVVLLSSVFPLTDAQRKLLNYRRDLNEYGDLIIRPEPNSEVPDEVSDGPTVEVERLLDLAGLALDTRSAVIEETDEDRYLVRVDGTVYVYEPPE